MLMARLSTTLRLSTVNGLLFFAMLFILRIRTNKYSRKQIVCSLALNKEVYMIAAFY